MTQADLAPYFSACASVAGALIGLLFVAITLRYEAVLGATASARNRAIAEAAFSSLLNALVISLIALLPGVNLGAPAILVAAFGLFTTVRARAASTVRVDTALRLLVLTSALYVSQLVVGGWLLIRGNNLDLLYYLAFVVLGAIIASLLRSWELVQPDAAPAAHPRPSSSPAPDPAARPAAD